MRKPNRPERKTIPRAVKMAVCFTQDFVCAGRGCTELVHFLPKHRTAFDHNPAIRLRDVLPDGSDYVPPQCDAKYIDALCFGCHAAKTHGTGATTAGTDTGKIKKERKRMKALVKIANDMVANHNISIKYIADKIVIKYKFGSRPLQSRNGFPPRGSRPMRSR